MALKKSEINVELEVDENHIPEKINWHAKDAGASGSTKAALMSFWDAEEKTTMRIDLWTKSMMVEEMKFFFYQNLFTMADVYFRATNDKDGADDIHKFAQEFGVKQKVIVEKK